MIERINDNEKEECDCSNKRANYKLIFMDCNMPVMDGLIATEKIRLMIGNEICIIALTAYCEEEIIDKCLSAGMNSLMTKPIINGDLARVLRELKII